jgi:hypothetical protein
MSEEQEQQFEAADVESHAHRAGAHDEPVVEEDDEVEAHIMRQP